mgnify:FL=1
MSPRRNILAEFTDELLLNWNPDYQEKKYIALRDTVVPQLMVSFSRKGHHSFVYDYQIKKSKNTLSNHRTKVFGKYPTMSIEEAREKVLYFNTLAETKTLDEILEVKMIDTVVYFIESSEGYIKIGKSSNWWARAKELTASSQGHRFIGFRIEDDVFNETSLHILFRKFRKPNSEYFDDTLNYIKALISKAVVYHEPKAKIKQTLEWYEEQIYEKDKQP